MRERGRLIAACVGAMLVVSTCGSKPGTTIEGGAGRGRYSVFSCGVRREYDEAGYRAAIHHRTNGGAAVGADVGARRRELVGFSPQETADAPPLGMIEDFAYAGMRAGYHFRFEGVDFAGFEVGAVALFEGPPISPGEPAGAIGASALQHDGRTRVLPAGEAWWGKRDVAFVWVEVLRDFETSRGFPAGLGFGHESWLHARVGLTLQGVTGELAYPIGGADAPVCVGAKGIYSGRDEYWVGGTLSYRFDL